MRCGAFVALGEELGKYLTLAHALRDGATFDTDEQIETMALQYLHRFDYNAVDAACSLYARHSIEVPPAAGVAANDSSPKLSSGETVAKWTAAFYRVMRLAAITPSDLSVMQKLHATAKANPELVPETEAGVLERLVARMSKWLETVKSVETEQVDRMDLILLAHGADDMTLLAPEKLVIEARVREFDGALVKLKDSLDRGSRRNQSKIGLEEVRPCLPVMWPIRSADAVFSVRSWRSCSLQPQLTRSTSRSNPSFWRSCSKRVTSRRPFRPC